MITKKCAVCGKTIHTNKNATKYCKSCRAKAYNKARLKASIRYNQHHRTTKITILKCEYCGKHFVSTHNKRYCGIKCRKYSTLEQNNNAVKKYKVKHGLNDKEKYFAYLGNSNLREHANKNFSDEQKLVRAEKRRLKLWKH